MRRRTVLYGFTKPRFMSRAPSSNRKQGVRLYFTVPLLGSFFALCVVPVRVSVCAAPEHAAARCAHRYFKAYVLISAYPDLCALWPRGEHPERCSKWGNAARPKGACAVEGARGPHTRVCHTRNGRKRVYKVRDCRFRRLGEIRTSKTAALTERRFYRMSLSLSLRASIWTI